MNVQLIIVTACVFAAIVFMGRKFVLALRQRSRCASCAKAHASQAPGGLQELKPRRG